MILQLKQFFQGDRVSGASEDFACELDLTGLELGGVKPFCAPVRVRGSVKGLAGSAELTAHVDYTISMPCDRCGEETRRDDTREFRHLLVRSLQSGEEDEDYVVVAEEQLDLDELLREDILLELPTKYLCREDCKGLCPKCGRNLNLGPCGCEEREIDPRLEQLKQLLS